VGTASRQIGERNPKSTSQREQGLRGGADMRFNFRSSAFATALVLLLTFQAYAQHTVRYKLIELALGGPVIV
jgi:hypothetical protein